MFHSALLASDRYPVSIIYLLFYKFNVVCLSKLMLHVRLSYRYQMYGIPPSAGTMVIMIMVFVSLLAYDRRQPYSSGMDREQPSTSTAPQHDVPSTASLGSTHLARPPHQSHPRHFVFIHKSTQDEVCQGSSQHTIQSPSLKHCPLISWSSTTSNRILCMPTP